MNIKFHYLITFVSLFSLGVIAAKPEVLHKDSQRERICKEARGKMVCEFKYSEDRIQTHLAEFRE